MNTPTIRSQICEDLGFLGIEFGERLNRINEKVISTAASQVTVHVIPTDEDGWLHIRPAT